MGRDTLSDTAYTKVAKEAKTAGSATHRGEQRKKQGLGLHPLVDPAGYELIRRSISWLEPEGDHFILLRGVAMLEETRLDTTGSMGNNVEVAMGILPATYKLLADGPNPHAVLSRYDVQMITAIFGDVCDDYILGRSQAEMDERIAEQMTLMFPEHGGGDTPEDPQYGLFGGAFLTWCSVNQYGLKYYDFTVSDAPGRYHLDPNTLIRVFGPTVFEKVAENGYQINAKNLPSTKEVVASLIEHAHAFFLQVDEDSKTSQFWRDMYGNERLIFLPNTRLLPYIKATIIGLTEGTLDLQSSHDFLACAGVSKDNARQIIHAVAKIPLEAQAILSNFNNIPIRGAKFERKNDIWPIGVKTDADSITKIVPIKNEEPSDDEEKNKDMWL